MSINRTKTQIQRDRLLISEMYLKHKRQDEIAEALNLSQSTVSRELKTLQAEWAKSSLMNIDQAKGKELSRIDMLELMYLEAWESSKGENKTVTKKGVMKAARQKLGKEGPETEPGGITSQEVTEHIETLVGDPRFLAGVMDCIQRRCAILGLDAPRKTDLTSMGQQLSQPVTTVEIVKTYEKPEQ